jgi:hypothetical protein
MTLPGFTAGASLYTTTRAYYAAAGRTSLSTNVDLAQLALPLPNGNGGCKPHFGPCTVPDTSCPTGFSRVICGVDCSCDTFCCTKPCPVTCGACSGGLCNPYPNCGPVPGSGTQHCTDCHGNPSTRQC